MADFSKQWCELNDSEMPWDFDILQIAEKLELDHFEYHICEGFGFIAISKDEEGEIELGFRNYITNLIEWKTYKEVIDGSI